MIYSFKCHTMRDALRSPHACGSSYANIHLSLRCRGRVNVCLCTNWTQGRRIMHFFIPYFSPATYVLKNSYRPTRCLTSRRKYSRYLDVNLIVLQQQYGGAFAGGRPCEVQRKADAGKSTIITEENTCPASVMFIWAWRATWRYESDLPAGKTKNSEATDMATVETHV